MKKIHVVILAAGKGSRMTLSPKTKVLMPVASFSMLSYVIKNCEELKELARESDFIFSLVLNDELSRDEEIEHLLSSSPLKFNLVVQDKPLGTGDAVRCATKGVSSDRVLVLYGDVPLVKTRSLLDMLFLYDKEKNTSLVSALFETDNPQAYGRGIVFGESLQMIVENSDCTEEQKALTLCNSGMMVCDTKALMSFFDSYLYYGCAEGSKEFYLTDIVKYINEKDMGNCLYTLIAEDEAVGANNYQQLSDLEKVMQSRIRRDMMNKGVIMQDPASVFFAYDTNIAAGVEICNNVTFGIGVKVESGSKILPFTYITSSHIKERSVIGPFAHIRPGNIIGQDCKIGSFSEVKNSNIGKGTKVPHLAYVGDADVGERVNFGAGSVICNYDGVKKNRSNIGNEAFIGANSSLISPVNIGNGSLVAAGSTIARDVSEGMCGIARARQVNKERRGHKSKDVTGEKLSFAKMHGLYNDFVVLYGCNQVLGEESIRGLAHRKKGIGCDQVLVLERQEDGFEMFIYNPDGSRAGACGNGARCAAFFLQKFGYVQPSRSEINLYVIDRLIKCTTTSISSNEAQVKVDMSGYEANRVICGREEAVYHISIGNDHIVFLVDSVANFDMKIASDISYAGIGQYSEKRANVSFASLSEKGIIAKTYEIGAGETMACGSAACACYIAMKKAGRLTEFRSDEAVTVVMEGGELMISEVDGHIFMGGAASLVFHGEFYISDEK